MPTHFIEKFTSKARNQIAATVADGPSEIDLEAGTAAAGSNAAQPAVPFHVMTAEQVARELDTSMEQGLTEREVAVRLEKYGPNELESKKPPSAFRVLLGHIFTFMNLVLMAALAIALSVAHWVDAVVIILVLVLNVVISFVQDRRATNAVEALRRMSGSTAVVLRDESLEEIPTTDVVPGDIVDLKMGDSVPADMRLFSVSACEVEEAVLTGESLPVQKLTDALDDINTPLGDRVNMVFSGTIVVKGRARGIVCATGMTTQMGNIASLLAEADKDQSFSFGSQSTKLQKRMNALGVVLVIVAVIAVGATIAAFAIHKLGPVWPDGLQAGVSTAVALIPEGLVPVLTLALSYGVSMMAKENALVRKVNALESLGNCTDICSDKTGTITQAKMTAEEMYVGGQRFGVTGSGVAPHGSIVEEKSGKPIETLSNAMMTALSCACLCNTAEIKLKKEENSELALSVVGVTGDMPRTSSVRETVRTALKMHKDKKKRKKNKKHQQKQIELPWVATGSPTEVALATLAMKAGLDRNVLTKDVSALYTDQIVEFPFDSSIKRMSVVHRATMDSSLVVFSKGAPERMLSICSHRIADADGNLMTMSETDLTEIMQINEDYAKRGLRVICLCYRVLEAGAAVDPQLLRREDVEQQLVYAGLVGIRDPPRPGVAEAVAMCQRAGITVHMLTGDHQSTAAAIARQVGILPQGVTDEQLASSTAVMTAADFDSLTDSELYSMKQLPLVIARCSPATKVRMVKALHARNRTCAMTGDGVNDAPSIKAADVGISMGKTGSDVTKQASDIVLLDDSFATIVGAVREGRRTFASIRKFCQHLLSSNVAEAIVLVLSVLVGLPLPCNPTQILYLNMITSTSIACGLIVEPVAHDLMDRNERPPNENLFTLESIMDIMFFGSVMGGLTLLVYVLVNELWLRKGLIMAQSAAFATLTILLLIQGYNCRHQRRPFFVDRFYSSYTLHAAVFIGLAACIVTLYVPWLNRQVFKQRGLSQDEWLMILAAAVIFLTFSEVYKAIKRFTYRAIRDYMQRATWVRQTTAAGSGAAPAAEIDLGLPIMLTGQKARIKIPQNFQLKTVQAAQSDELQQQKAASLVAGDGSAEAAAAASS